MNDAGVTVICAFISPYASDRERSREIIGAERFLEVHLNTPVAVCEERDPHGLYKKARAGEIKNFTGVNDPYEQPENPALRLDTGATALAKCVEDVVALVVNRSAL
jgi:adenylylsulfate kinase